MYAGNVLRNAVVGWVLGAPYMPNTKEVMLLTPAQRCTLFARLMARNMLPTAGTAVRELNTHDGGTLMKLLAPSLRASEPA